jgi:hypothetical protein
VPDVDGEQPPPVNPLWQHDVEGAIHWVASRQRELTTDDVWARLAEVSDHRTPEHRAMGPLMRAAAKRRWIEATYSTVISRRRRGAPVRVWRSLIYQVQARRELLYE